MAPVTAIHCHVTVRRVMISELSAKAAFSQGLYDLQTVTVAV